MSLSANGRSLELNGGPVALSPGLDRLEFGYTGLYFSEPQQLRFRHRLVGLDREWVETGSRRSVDYNHLPPGHYRFEVSASIGNGRWSVPPAALQVDLAPFFWERPWFKIAAILSVAAAIAGAVRWRERRRTERYIALLERRQAVDAERSRIARDLHDDIGATLTQVALLSELAQSNFESNPNRSQAHINEIFTTAQEITRALDEIVWAVSPRNDTVQSFVLFLCGFVQDYSSAGGLRCRLDVMENLPVSPMDAEIRHHLYLATKEALANVIKHARATEVRFRLSVEADQLRLVVEDDGCGFSAAQDVVRPGSDGVMNLQQRLAQLGGSCTIQSNPGSGTVVEMTVSLGTSAD